MQIATNMIIKTELLNDTLACQGISYLKYSLDITSLYNISETIDSNMKWNICANITTAYLWKPGDMAEVAVNIMFGQCEQRNHSLYKNVKLQRIEIQIVIQMQGYI